MSRTIPPERILEHFQGEARALLDDLRVGDPVAVREFYQSGQGVPVTAHGLSQRHRAVSRSKEAVTMDRQTPISSETDTTFSIDIQEQVRRRAFEIYEQRGREDGHELDDWLQAEAEVVSQRSKAMGAGA